MRVSLALACAAFLSAGAAIPAQAGCGWGRCASTYPRVYIHFAQRCCQAPAGWGMYRRAKLHHDCGAPLAIVDELGGVTLVRSRR